MVEVVFLLGSTAIGAAGSAGASHPQGLGCGVVT